MGNIIDLTPLLAIRPQVEEMTIIVTADTVYDAFGEYAEAPNDESFLDVLAEIVADLQCDMASPEELNERYWWAVARRYAINNGIELIDQKFCRDFNPFRNHTPALQWARKFLDTLPSRYSDFLKGDANA
ncbi:hypothetical protein CCR94_01955 [Rhodoblastus sphagnicola]|uniref:Uncharacterized protein n=1 Tax=Rhodoblastus sphagnicola TaxID=333368 RepID=A0A2S6NFJ5_9HYPH|nr:hypothetical protein [Rhodoblastus sphagnicola]MBB4199205.1 hypothetical protein [Rhodoblastus sphagnicola]PPQ33386.1 hypothetical protein CCR94_01955 [Rhodoblastus sphagnicola]